MTPFDITYGKILELMQARNLVALNNIISYDGVKRRPEKPGVATADLPELVLYLAHVRGNFHQNSSSAKFTTTWRWVQSSGVYDSRVNNALNWAMLQILGNWKENFAALEYLGNVFIRDIRLMTADSGQDASEKNRNIRGWITIMDFEIDMYFATADFLAEIPE